jgi:hypothetical protein
MPEDPVEKILEATKANMRSRRFREHMAGILDEWLFDAIKDDNPSAAEAFAAAILALRGFEHDWAPRKKRG